MINIVEKMSTNFSSGRYYQKYNDNITRTSRRMLTKDGTNHSQVGIETKCGNTFSDFENLLFT